MAAELTGITQRSIVFCDVTLRRLEKVYLRFEGKHRPQMHSQSQSSSDEYLTPAT